MHEGSAGTGGGGTLLANYSSIQTQKTSSVSACLQAACQVPQASLQGLVSDFPAQASSVQQVYAGGNGISKASESWQVFWLSGMMSDSQSSVEVEAELESED